jgi:hypothetical protein
MNMHHCWAASRKPGHQMKVHHLRATSKHHHVGASASTAGCDGLAFLFTPSVVSSPWWRCW